MNLFNEHVMLRAIEIDDAIFLHALINDADTENSIIGWSKPISLSDQTEWIKGIKDEKDIIRYIVCSDNCAVGVITLTDIDFKNQTAKINIKLSQNARGKGIGKNAVNLLLSYAFNQLNMNSIAAVIFTDNIVSQKMFEKCGFKREGELRQRVYKNGKFNNIYWYSIIANEFYDRIIDSN